ncbi:MAG TPA: class I SAM-dependent methyltransferase, partial [Caldilineaceae bacterium]|nr:class I SAM-dependent methyltransferase [Caldilineaceae bacterium]
PPRKLLELGCGTGWMAELLALLQFDVVGTSISPYEIEDAKSRIQSLAAKRINFSLRFHATPMETVDEAVGDYLPFDGVFVFEALHHAYNWRQALAASYRCLRPGGWLVIAQEPNVSHTYVAYRVAKLSNTHEIGFSRKELVQQLNAIGFINVSVVKDRVAFRVKPHWLVAQKDL